MTVATVPADLTAKLLIAMPGMGDPRFAGSVVFLCSHSRDGAMGLIVNKRMDEVTFAELLEQLEIERPGAVPDVPVCYGGPVELRRGFVLHSSDYAPRGEEGLEIDGRFSMTATLDMSGGYRQRPRPASRACWRWATRGGGPVSWRTRSPRMAG
jgi:putative transcriptional regulator